MRSLSANPRNSRCARGCARPRQAAGRWSRARRTPQAAHPAEAATAATREGPGGRPHPPRGQAALRQARRPRQEGLHNGRAPRKCLGGRAEPHQFGEDLPAFDFAALRYVAKPIEGGHTDSEIGRSRVSRLGAITAKKIHLADAPMKGSPARQDRAVELADYECPHCKRFQPVLHHILDRVPQRRQAVLQALPAAPAHECAALGRGGGGGAEAREVLVVPGQALGVARSS